jgi:predicted acylesterase/phospholipase RssA
MDLLVGLDPIAVGEILAQMRPRRFETGEFICREGEPGESLFLIQTGVAEVVIEGEGERAPVARCRRGDVIGEMSLVTGEPRSASLVACVPTEALELRREVFIPLLSRYPAILSNLCQVLSRRLARTSARLVTGRRGEAVALVAGPAGAGFLRDVVDGARAASPRNVAAIDLACHDLERFLTELDDLLSTHGTVVAMTNLEQEGFPLLLLYMDRMVALVTETEARRLAALVDKRSDIVQVVLLGAKAGAQAPVAGLHVAGTVDPASRTNFAWLGRHISRTKIGLALGAGGAKGYAHIGVLQALEEGGYRVDYVGGTSVGAMVGAWLAMGMTTAEIEATMRRAYSPENVDELFRLSLSGLSSGGDLQRRMCRETTLDRSFAQLVLPLVVMAVDLIGRRATAIREGPVWEALVASTAVAGLFPALEKEGRRLVDGVALIPVPSGEVSASGADITVSVNLMNRETMPAWPGKPASPSRATRRVSTLDTLLEVMDLAQLDASVRHAAEADVVISPRFGPSTWRDFHLADLFVTAGRAAAQEQLATLRSLARPQVA